MGETSKRVRKLVAASKEQEENIMHWNLPSLIEQAEMTLSLQDFNVSSFELLDSDSIKIILNAQGSHSYLAYDLLCPGDMLTLKKEARD